MILSKISFKGHIATFSPLTAMLIKSCMHTRVTFAILGVSLSTMRMLLIVT